MTEMKATLRLKVEELVGKTCWAFAAGTGTGSQVTLEFGRRVPRRYVLTNPTLSDEQRQYQGELALFIQCVWRLDAPSEIVIGSDDSECDMEAMMQGLSSLVGVVVRAVTLVDPGCDLTLSFDSGASLKIFCDRTSEASLGNYSLHAEDVVVIVGPSSVVSCESTE